MIALDICRDSFHEWTMDIISLHISVAKVAKVVHSLFLLLFPRDMSPRDV